MAITYKVDSNTLEVTVYNSEQDNPEIPFLAQPNFPDGTPFKDEKEAIAWAEYFVAHHLDGSKILPINSGEM